MSQFDWLVKAYSNSVFTVFDTETTGLEPKSCRVVEVGGIKFDARGVNARFDVLINPAVPMPPEVTKVNGITDAMLKGQPEAARVMPDFLHFIGKSVLIAHNAPFDVNFINAELARLNLPHLDNPVVDTRIFAREMFPGLPKYALQDLAVRFGIKAVEAHRAEDDARVCMELFLVCLNELKRRNPHLEDAGVPKAVEPEVQLQKPGTVPANASTEPETLFDDDDFDEEDEFGENPE